MARKETSKSSTTVLKLLVGIVLLSILCGGLLAIGWFLFAEKLSLDSVLPSESQITEAERDALATASVYRQQKENAATEHFAQTATAEALKNESTVSANATRNRNATSTAEVEIAQQKTATIQSQIAAQATQTRLAAKAELATATALAAATQHINQNATSTALAAKYTRATSTALAFLHQSTTATVKAVQQKQATATARSKPPTGRVSSETLNVRPGPGTEYDPPLGGLKRGDTVYIIGRNQASDGSLWWQIRTHNGWVHSGFVDESGCLESECVPQVTRPPTATPRPTKKSPKPTSTPQPSQQWVLVADSLTDYPGPIIDRRWWYLWSSGRNNFRWQDMAGGHPDQCYKSPNDWNLEICRDLIITDRRGDVSILWKYGQNGTYRFEWDSNALKFYRHLQYIGSQRPGRELRYSTTFKDVNQWELFFWVATNDTKYRIKVYRLQE